MAFPHLRVRTYVLGGIVLALVVLVALWNWDWFIPLADREASAALGRPVTIQHLVLRIARNPVVEVDGLTIGNPPDFPAGQPLASIGRLAVTLDAPAYITRRALVLLHIIVDKPVVAATQLPDGRNNWTFGSGPPNTRNSATGTSSGGALQIGDVRIADGQVHAVLPRLKGDFQIRVATRDAPPNETPNAPAGAPDSKAKEDNAQLVADAGGTYAGQPITGQFLGGALLSLRNKTNPYPVDLKLQNGPTRVALNGTLKDPLAFGGADIRLDLTGPNLALLTPLTGIPMPTTRPFRMAGHLDYADRRIRFRDIAGRVGNSDISGVFAVDPGAERPQVTAELSSNEVDLTDLSGLMGAASSTGAPVQAKGRVLPTTPISLPRLQFADVDLKYRGKRIQGRFMPLDNLSVVLSINNGTVSLHPVSFGVGTGDIAGDILLEPHGDDLHARINIRYRQVDVARLMAATHAFSGAGTIGGESRIDGTGDSVAGILGNGNGETKLFMTGGDLSALLVNLSGLEFGNALMSALGLPTKTPVRCMVADLPLQDGVLTARTFILDTTENNVTITGHVNLRDEAIDLQLKTEAKHFSIGSLPGPIDIGGHLADPAIRPSAQTVARGGLAAGLGALLTPLGALIPTIQLGLGENNNCGELIHAAENGQPVKSR